jgi:hypothetical protein
LVEQQPVTLGAGSISAVRTFEVRQYTSVLNRLVDQYIHWSIAYIYLYIYIYMNFKIFLLVTKVQYFIRPPMQVTIYFEVSNVDDQ